MRNRILRALFGMLLFTGLSQTQALVINFSDFSSDATPVALLDAELTFDVTAGGADFGNDLLTLTLDNLTTAPDAYTINKLFFNFTGTVTGFDSTNSGLGVFNAGPASADGFGSFDVMVDSFLLASGATEVWLFDLGGTGFSMNDFNVLSIIPPGDTPSTAALKFVQGPGDDSAFGASIAVVPVPAAVWLFGSGLIGLIGVAKRKA